MTRPRILIVDDTEASRDLLVQLLEDDYEVLTAVDGRAAVESTVRERPDLVLMDLSLPVLDGLEATRQIRANPITASTIVIAVTAHAMPGDEEEARSAGLDDYITKPIDDDLLFERIRLHLGERRP